MEWDLKGFVYLQCNVRSCHRPYTTITLCPQKLNNFDFLQTVYLTIFQDILAKGKEGGLNSLEQV